MNTKYRDLRTLAALGAFGAGVLFKSCSSDKAKKVTDHVFTNLQGNELWKYSYPLNEEGESTPNAMKSAQDQEIVDFVTAIRTNAPLNTAEECAMSTLTAIMGRISAYTGKEVTLEEMMNSGLRLGPEEVTLGPSDIRAVIAVPGTDNQRKNRF